MYINHEEVYELLEEGKKATREDIINILEKAREKKGISHKDIAALLTKYANPKGKLLSYFNKCENWFITIMILL